MRRNANKPGAPHRGKTHFGLRKREKLRIALLAAAVLLAAASFTIGTILKHAEKRRAESVVHGATFVLAEGKTGDGQNGNG